MELLTKKDINKRPPTEKIMQYGEGNFLRAFIDFFVDQANEKGLINGSIVAVQPIAQGMGKMINDQNGLYTVVLRGLENKKEVTEKRLVTALNRCINPYEEYDLYMENVKNPQLRIIISNTTEAGITYIEGDTLEDKPPASFPAKVTQFLYRRFTHFNGDATKGFIFVACELIDNSGSKLKEIVLQYAKTWGLEADFIDWINNANYFVNTLVDRIVTGYPKDEAEQLWEELGYKDNLLATAEIFHFFVLEGEEKNLELLKEEFPLQKISKSIIWTSDATPYKQRKVRLLNGGHTMSVLAAHLCGKETVGEMMQDPVLSEYLRQGMYNEVIPTLDLSKEDLVSFADSVFDRFSNPFIKHYLLSIALNSVSKYKARVLPTLLEYQKRKGELPKNITFSLAALIVFYKGDKANDDTDIIDFFKNVWQETNIETVTQKVLANESFWGLDLNNVPHLTKTTTENITNIINNGMVATIKSIVS
ncbi:MAG: tagaturonate reductase [Defluviitaleaceae bacterium]|nr:tagaturonate reductase [Defluviitaleaceae bacterium]